MVGLYAELVQTETELNVSEKEFRFGLPHTTVALVGGVVGGVVGMSSIPNRIELIERNE